MYRSIIILLLSVTLAGCGGEKEKEAAVKIQTTDSQVIVQDTPAEIAIAEATNPEAALSAPTKKRIGRYTVQIGAFRSEQRAIEARTKYNSMGYDAYMERTTVGGKDRAWFRVRIGHFQRISEAEKVSKELNAKGGVKTWVDRISG